MIKDPIPDPTTCPGATLFENGAEYVSDGKAWILVKAIKPGLHFVQIDPKPKKTRKFVLSFGGVKISEGEMAVDDVCECGAAKTGIFDFAPGHSSWCPVKETT